MRPRGFAESLAEKLRVRRWIAGYGDKPMPVLQCSEDAAGNREVVRFARKISGRRLSAGSLVRKANFGCGHPIRRCDRQNAGTFGAAGFAKAFPCTASKDRPLCREPLAWLDKSLRSLP